MNETKKNQAPDKPANESSESFHNPIDKDKITESPHLLPYAHTVGGAVIKPIDKGRVKGLAVASMYEQTEMQLDQIREQVNLLVRQAQAIKDRVRFSEAVYLAEVGFKPLIGKIYHLYKKNDGKDVLSMIGPQEWGKRCPYDFQASLKLLSDHTWEVVNE
jgi:Protein of unknown function (DUF2452)